MMKSIRITDNESISNFLRNLSRCGEVSAIADIAGREWNVSVFFSGRRMTELSVRITESGYEAAAGENIRVSLQKDGNSFWFQSEVTSCYRGIVTIKKPDFVCLELGEPTPGITAESECSEISAYPRTFWVNQTLADPQNDRSTLPAKKAESDICDTLLSKPEFLQYISLIEIDLPRSLEYFRNTAKVIGNPACFQTDVLQCLQWENEAMEQELNGLEYRCVHVTNTRPFLDYCREKLSKLEQDCFTYVPNESFTYRRLWEIKKGDSTAAFVVGECFPEGIRLINPLDQCHIYFVGDSPNFRAVLMAAIGQTASFFRENGRRKFRIYLKAWKQEVGSLQIPGLKYLFPVGRVLANREGIHTYKKLLDSDLISLPQAYNLTCPQLSIWYTEKVYPGTSFGNIAGLIRIPEEIHPGLLERAINLVILHNEGIRTRISDTSGQPVQYFVPFEYRSIDFIDYSSQNGLESFYRWEEYKNGAPFQLIDSDLFYFAILRFSEKEGGFYIKTHHLISDAWTSSSLLISEIMEYYSQLKADILPGKHMPQYTDFIFSEEEYKKSEAFLESRHFWNAKFETLPEMTSFKPAASLSRSTAAGRKTFRVPEGLTVKILEYCRESGYSPFTMFISVLSIYLSRVSSKNDLVIGTPVLNRSNAREKETVGMFISMVPFRMNVASEASFTEYMDWIQREWKQILKHQKYPYDLILRDFREKYRVMESLFDVAISYQNSTHKKTETPYEVDWIFNHHQTEALVIHISNRDDDDQFTLEFDYLLEAFLSNEIEEMYCRLIVLLEDALSNPAKKLSALEVLSSEEKRKILNEFNHTESEYPRDKVIQQLFEEQVVKSQDRIALICDNAELTYEALNIRANQLAWMLIERGIGQDEIIPIISGPCFELIIGMMAVLKSGGAFLPIDPAYPAERIRYIINDSNASIILISGTTAEGIKMDKDLICLDTINWESEKMENPVLMSRPESLAYVIYTSGSTGFPKGVMIEHRSLINLCWWHISEFGITPSDKAAKYAGVGFDATVWEIFPYILCGAGLYVLDSMTKLDMEALNACFEKNNITVAFLPTQICEEFMHLNNQSLRILLTGGDKLRMFASGKCSLINNYGPTENTVVSTSFPVSTSYANIPIGRPISNTKIYILDSYGRLQPLGIPGELCLSGEGLARGYLGKPELTMEKFIPNPFEPGKRLYRTGDLARWLPDGNVEFLGRMDHQVKIRGFRIELGEVESQLLAFGPVKKAVVTAEEEGNGKRLCAYVVLNDPVSLRKMRDFLAQKLPDYMIPSSVYCVHEIPLNQNGKIDYHTLKSQGTLLQYDSVIEKPRNDTEVKLAEICRTVLGLEQISVVESFFDLGGDSLSALQVQSIACINNLDIDMQDFYKYRTIRAISEKLIRSAPDLIQKEEPLLQTQSLKLISGTGRDSLPEKTDLGNIFLTGATGFLGVHLLNKLLSKTKGDIYCLVRGRHLKESVEKLNQTYQFYFPGGKISSVERIHVLQGDISLNAFGLSSEMLNELGTKIQTVIHTAALVKHFGDYSEFEKINVGGTKEIVWFAEKYQLKLIHISTMSLANAHDSSNVYLKSKSAAETLVKKAVNRGLDAGIFRVGNLTGRFRDGFFQKNIKENNFYRILKSLIEFGTISDEMDESVFEFSPVDVCAEMIVDLSRKATGENRLFHLFNPRTVEMGELVRLLKEMGIKMDKVNREAYTRLLKKISQEKTGQEILPGLISYLKYQEIFNKKNYSVQSKLDQGGNIVNANLKWPPIGKEYIRNVLGHMEDVGYLNFNKIQRRTMDEPSKHY